MPRWHHRDLLQISLNIFSRHKIKFDNGSMLGFVGDLEQIPRLTRARSLRSATMSNWTFRFSASSTFKQRLISITEANIFLWIRAIRCIECEIIRGEKNKAAVFFFKNIFKASCMFPVHRDEFLRENQAPLCYRQCNETLSKPFPSSACSAKSSDRFRWNASTKRKLYLWVVKIFIPACLSFMAFCGKRALVRF